MNYPISDEIMRAFARKAIRNAQGKYEVTILVGNGFDIGLGLNTRYSDFLNRYLKPTFPVRTGAIKAMKDEVRRQRDKVSDSWADAELAFAQLDFSSYPHKDGAVGALAECEGDFTEALGCYLADEEHRFYIPPERQNEAKQKFLVQLQILLDLKIPELAVLNTVNLEFFNFNYTSTLDKLLVGDVISLKDTDRNLSRFNIGGVHHIHGQLSRGNIVFGVDSDAQIADRQVSNASQQVGYLVKSELDATLHVNELESFNKRISESDMIILFGLSYGGSDMSLWQSIFHVMQKQPLLDVVLCGYAEVPPSVRGAAMMQKLTESERTRFATAMNNFYDFDIHEYADHLHVVGYNYYRSPNGKMVYSDPLGLKWFGHEFVHQ